MVVETILPLCFFLLHLHNKSPCLDWFVVVGKLKGNKDLLKIKYNHPPFRVLAMVHTR